MKMYKSVFKYPNYGQETHYKNVAELKTLLAKRKGKTKEKREELLTLRRKERAEKRIKNLRAAHKKVIEYANKSQEEAQNKHVHPRHKRA